MNFNDQKQWTGWILISPLYMLHQMQRWSCTTASVKTPEMNRVMLSRGKGQTLWGTVGECFTLLFCSPVRTDGTLITKWKCGIDQHRPLLIVGLPVPGRFQRLYEKIKTSWMWTGFIHLCIIHDQPEKQNKKKRHIVDQRRKCIWGEFGPTSLRS